MDQIEAKNEPKARLKNGQVVRAGDEVVFTSSDGVEMLGVIMVNPYDKTRLYFWNLDFDILDYDTARLA